MFTKIIPLVLISVSLSACGGGGNSNLTIDCPVVHQAINTVSHQCIVGNRAFIHHESSNTMHVQMHRASLVNGRVLLVGSLQDVGDITGSADITEENGIYTLNEYIY